MLGAAAALVAMNSCAKILREDGFTTAEIIFYRTTPGLVWLWAEVRRRQKSLRPVRADLVALRSAFGIAAMAATFFAVHALTLVQHQVLLLLQPVFVALFAPWFLRERMHRLALLALMLAASGAFLVLAPGGDLSTLPLVPALVGVGGAICSALAHVTIRKTSETEAPELVVFHFALLASVAGLAWGLTHDEFRLVRLLTPTNLALIAGTAACGTLGQLWMTRAYGLAPASHVAMVAYAAIPLSLGVDVLLWGALAPVSGLAGAILMVAAGFLIARKPTAQPGQP